MKKNKLTLFGLMIIYFIVILSISVAYSFCNEKLSLSGTVTIKTEAQNDYEYTVMASNSWQNNEYYYYQYTITVNYLGEENISAWNVYIDMPLDSIITGCYNANECIIENSILKMDNASYNGNLDSNNNSFSIGFQFYTTSPSYELTINKIDFFTEKQNQGIDNPSGGEGDENEEGNPEISDDLKEKIVFNMTTDNFWGNVTAYTFSIENQSDIDLKSWQVEIEFSDGDTVSNLWGAEYIMKENILIMSSPSWNSSFSSSIKEQGGIQMIINNNMVPFYDYKILSIKVITSNMEEVVIK